MPALDRLTGQETLKRNLRIAYCGALELKRRMPNGLILGPAGMGKTTFARAIAEEVNIPLVHDASATKTTNLDLLVLRWQTMHSFDKKPGFVFLDEIHLLPKSAQDSLLTLMSKGEYTDRTNTVLSLPLITLIGATTNLSYLLPALVSRCNKFTIEPYSKTELAEMALSYAESEGYKVDYEWCLEMAYRPEIESPREIISAVNQSARLNILGENFAPDAVAESLGYNVFGLETIECEIILAYGESYGTATLASVSQSVRMDEREVAPYIQRLRQRDIIKSKTGFGSYLTQKGIDILHQIKEQGN